MNYFVQSTQYSIGLRVSWTKCSVQSSHLETLGTSKAYYVHYVLCYLRAWKEYLTLTDCSRQLLG